jgi:hypothetical protein
MLLHTDAGPNFHEITPLVLENPFCPKTSPVSLESVNVITNAIMLLISMSSWEVVMMNLAISFE